MKLGWGVGEGWKEMEAGYDHISLYTCMNFSRTKKIIIKVLLMVATENMEYTETNFVKHSKVYVKKICNSLFKD